MAVFTVNQLEGAQKAILSALHKNRKTQETLVAKQALGTWQITRVARQIEALGTASSLVAQALGQPIVVTFSRVELQETVQVLDSLIQQVEKIKSKFNQGTPQYTLAIRRIEAFKIAAALAADYE